MAVLSFSQAIFAQSYDFSAVTPNGQTLYYNFAGTGKVWVSGATSGITGVLNIPSSVTYNNNTYQVVRIAGQAFFNQSNITSVIIPSTVTTIGTQAFAHCTGITSATIPNSVTTIQSYVFQGCSSLTYIDLPDSLSVISNYTFLNCSSLSSVEIPNTVTVIEGGAFKGCSNLTNITIPNSVTSIGMQAFAQCNNLSITNFSGTIAQWCNLDFADKSANPTSRSHNLHVNNTAVNNLVIPNGVTMIKKYVFTGCNITSIAIPSSVLHIGDDAFFSCDSLTITNFLGTLTQWCNIKFDTYHSNPAALSHNLYINNIEIVDLVIPNGIQTIKQYSFSGCDGIASVSIPNTVTSIGKYAFYGCGGLDTVIIPEYVSCVDTATFMYCDGLTSITLPSSMDSIKCSAFCGCSSLSSIIIPSTISSIGSGAFVNCTSLMSVYMLSNTPPTIIGNLFGLDEWDWGLSSRTIYIPCGKTSVYQNTWGMSYVFSESWTPYNITANTCDTQMGSVMINIHICGTSINAIANNGYHFTHWNDGDITNPRLIVPTQDTSLIAFFSKNQYFITGIANDSIKGYVTGSDTVFYLDTVSLFATANYGYHFNRWDDYSTNNPHTLIATNNIIRIAFFDYNQYNLFVQSDTSIHGTCTGSGSYNYLSERQISAIANNGYHFTSWNDGSVDNPRTITLTQDTVFTAFFAPNQYTLIVTADEHGTVTGSGTYFYGDTVIIQAIPDAHHHFVFWDDGNLDNPRQYLVEEDKTLTAHFAIDTHTVNVVSNDFVRGMAEASGTHFAFGSPCTVTATAYTGYTFAGWSNGITANPYTFAVISDVELMALFVEEGEEVYTVTVESADPTMGSVSGGGQALYGGTLTIRAIPNEGYQFLNWQDGNTENPRTVTVTGNITYTAHFESTQGIEDIDVAEIKIYATEGRIVVQGADGLDVRVYDITGREMIRAARNGETPLLPNGVYLVKVGTLPARKVVVLR